VIHYVHPALTERFSVTVVGAGGNGSQMLTCLARLHHAITALGHEGFDLTVYDPDTVSPANIGRQMFSPSDVGAAKVDVLITRINSFFGLAWEARPVRFDAEARADLVIACVDSPKSRAEVRRQIYSAPYLLDLGNRAADGQALLGQVLPARGKDAAKRLDLPEPYKLLPELVSAKGKQDDAPSCSVAEALTRQELFINDDVTRVAGLILWNLLRHGQITWHGAFVNAASGHRRPIPVDPEVWKRMTPTPTAAPKPRRAKK
jgi:PRTRC genetic system ThiF family protein